MSKPNNVATEKERLAQLARRKKSQELAAASNQARVDRRRHRVIGEIVCRHFPELNDLQPGINAGEDKAIFLPVEISLAMLAADTEYVDRLRKLATHK